MDLKEALGSLLLEFERLEIDARGRPLDLNELDAWKFNLTTVVEESFENHALPHELKKVWSSIPQARDAIAGDFLPEIGRIIAFIKKAQEHAT